MRTKQILLFLFLICFSFNVLAQFPADKVYILLNTEVEVAAKEKSQQEYGFDRFFVDESLTTKYILKSGPTPYDSLVAKKFKVIDIIDFQRYGERKYKLKLENPKIGILYYDYDPTLKLIYPFVLLSKETNEYCSQLTRTIDKFNGDVTIDTPLLNSISYTKVISKKTSKLYMSVRQNGATLNVGEYGLTILFSNGKKLTKPSAKISVDAGSDGWDYSVFIPLLPTDIKLLSENIITDVKLYIYDGSITNGSELKDLLNCIIKAK